MGDWLECVVDILSAVLEMLALDVVWGASGAMLFVAADDLDVGRVVSITLELVDNEVVSEVSGDELVLTVDDLDVLR